MKQNREKQTAALLKAQLSRKKQTRRRVFKVIKAFRAEGRTVDFPGVAKAAGVSVSYLYKWERIKKCIESLRDKSDQLSSRQDHQFNKVADIPEEFRPHSLKTSYEAARKRIQELQAEIEELKRQNEQYRGYIAEIYELRDENERLITQLRELLPPEVINNVVPLRPTSKTATPIEGISDDIIQMVEKMGIKLGVRLQREIKHHTSGKVILAIKAFEQYRSKTVIENPGACLLAMIRDEAEPNLHQKPISIEDQEFNRWYAEAIDSGFCLDIPKNHLGSQDGELVVKVRAKGFPGGYQLVKWREAQLLMRK